MNEYPYTVLLLFPDYLAPNNYGEDTLLYHVTAGSRDDAIAAAKLEAAESAHGDKEADRLGDDFLALMVVPGHVANLLNADESAPDYDNDGPRVIIETRGGVVVAVHSSHPSLSVSILDRDDQADDDTPEAGEPFNALEAEISTLHAVL